MSKTTDYVIDYMNSLGDQRLAQQLGITYEELLSLDYDIETDSSNDGVVYAYRIEFSENSPPEILEKIKRIDGYEVIMEPWEIDTNFDYDEQYEAIVENKGYVEKFFTEIDKLTQLSQLEIPNDDLDGILKRQIFISVIGTMETFLSDTFINLTNENKVFFRNFIETHPEFKQRKFDLKDIFIQNEKLQETAKIVMLETIYHNLPTIKNMFSDTFKIEFPSIAEVYPLVLKRHDLVHRNGKTKEGEIIDTNGKSIEDLINKVCEFVTNLAGQLGLEH